MQQQQQYYSNVKCERWRRAYLFAAAATIVTCPPYPSPFKKINEKIKKRCLHLTAAGALLDVNTYVLRSYGKLYGIYCGIILDATYDTYASRIPYVYFPSSQRTYFCVRRTFLLSNINERTWNVTIKLYFPHHSRSSDGMELYCCRI